MIATLIERRIRWSGILIVLGLLVQMLSLHWTHPLAFMCFLLVSCPMIGAGILIYLYSLASHDAQTPKSPQP
jgi:fatty-acid desaturase